MNGGKNPGKSSTMKEKKTSIVVVFRLHHKGEAGKVSGSGNPPRH
jgi:hypothetical protein